jgi:Putative lumazine-binding
MTPKLLALAAVFSLFLNDAPAPAPSAAGDRRAIEQTVGHYFQAGDTSSSAELREAFHPAAMMFFVKDGALNGVSQPEWWARADATKAPVVALSRAIPAVDVAGDAAFAKVVSVYPTHRFEDYMTLVKLDGRWWIVGKIFHRTVPPDAPAAAATAVDAERNAIRTSLETLHRALETNDPDLAASVTDPRAMAYTLLEGRLVGISAAEGQARLAARRAAGETVKATRRVALVDAEGDAGVARLEHDLPSGRWIDYASLLKVGGQWKIVGLVYARQSVSP